MDTKASYDKRRELLLEKANRLPLRPGVYIMKDKNGKVIYVGKSRALKNRVSSYFHESAKHNEKTRRMVSMVYSFDYILTDTEIEALSLENSLIKQYTPKYNIKLKDSKSYPYIKLTVNDEYPKLTVTRKRLADGARYFGPYSSISAVYSILGTIQKAFGIASCSREFPRDIGKERPCLNRHIGMCIAPCTGEISSEEYRAIFKEVASFLRGSFSECESSLREKMEFASDNLMFEAAARYRDRIEALSKLWQRQKVVGSPDTEEDVIALYTDEICSCISVFYIRGGSITDNEHFIFPAEQIIDEENMSAFLSELYNIREYVPREIILDFTLPNEELAALTEAIRQRVGYKPDIRTPERGDRRRLCEMVYDNAKQQALLYKAQSEKDNKTLVKLASMLSLEVVPERIEAYDISNFGNDNITAGMIVAENCKLKKSDYRTFKIKTTDGIDDYGAMREALSRRLNHLTDESFGGAPDLILLDGGKAHVSVIRELMAELGCEIPVFGMVKDDFHKTRALTDDINEISISREQAVFQFIYKLQEEVHRYTITRMENAKSKTLKHSTLEDIDGIGRIKAKSLLAHFRSLTAIKNADKSELMKVSGITSANADAIIAHFFKKHASTKKIGEIPMRIITGSARGIRLDTLEGEATRPTAERVKEALFSMIQFDLVDTTVLDLFAGSGQLGLEALSRGAEKAVLVDKSAEAVAIIKKNAQKTHLWERCRLVLSDYAEYLRVSKGKYKFDYVFLDPPYNSGMLQKSLHLLAESDLLAEGAWVICEDETDDVFGQDEALAKKYTIEKQNRYGRIFITVLTLKCD